MTELPDVPLPILTALAVAELLLSAIMLSLVWTRWKERRILGFSFGDTVRHSPLTWAELGEIALVLAFLYFQFLLANLGLHKLGLLSNETQTAIFVIICQILFYLAFLGLIHWMLMRKHRTWSEAFGFRSTSLSSALATALVTLGAALIPVQILGWITHKLFEFFHWPLDQQPVIEFFLKVDNPWIRIVMIGMALIGAPLTEELFFRGLLYPCLKERLGFRHALWINALLFALIHRHLPSMIPLFGLGIAFTLVYEWRGNLLSCMFFHAGFNSLSLLLLYFLKGNPL